MDYTIIYRQRKETFTDYFFDNHFIFYFLYITIQNRRNNERFKLEMYIIIYSGNKII